MTSFFDFFQGNGNLVLLNLILQTTLLSGIAIVMARRYKNNAAARYGILFPALLSLLLLSATSLFFQSRNASLFYLPVELEGAQASALVPEFILDELAIPGFEIESVSSESVGSNVGQQSSVAAKNTNTAWGLLLSLPSYLIFMAIWIGGFLILTLGLLRSFHNVEQVSRNSSQLSLSEKQRLDKLLAEVLSKKTGVPFRVSDQISSPMLTGLLAPVILLPKDFVLNLNERQLKSVLLHELAHFERKDLLANFLQKIVFIIFWFHPLVHVMDRMIARAREEICDNYVLAKEKPLDYSEALLQVSTLASMCEAESGGSGFAVGMFGREWNLEQRIGELLSESRERSMKLSRRTGWIFQSSLIGVSVLLASCQLGVAESSDAADNSDEQSVLAQDVISNQQDAQGQPERGARQLIDQSVPLEQASAQPSQQDGSAAYVQTQATTQAQPQAQTQSRPAPVATTAGTLSPRIMEAISQVQEYMQPADSDTEADMDAAKDLLDRLYSERFDRMNDFEKSTTLSFYTNYYLGTENYPEAIRSFEQALTIRTLSDDIRLRTFRSLGQLYATVENWEDSIQYYQLWREASPQEDEVTFRGLSYAHYQLEQFDEALPNWLSYMELVRNNDGELNRDAYSYLNGLYFTLEDFDSALELTKEMILLFNEPVDWRNLRAIFAELDDLQETTEIEEELTGAVKEFRTDSQITGQIVASDGDYLPLIAVAPQYPTGAAQRGIEGWILLAFTVDKQGSVVDDSVKVIDSEPQNIFNRSAIRAALKFKYEPRVRNGKTVAVPGVKYVFRYKLEENA